MEGGSDYVGEAPTLEYDTQVMTQKATAVGTGESKATIRDDKDDDDIMSESDNSPLAEDLKDAWATANIPKLKTTRPNSIMKRTNMSGEVAGYKEDEHLELFYEEQLDK